MEEPVKKTKTSSAVLKETIEKLILQVKEYDTKYAYQSRKLNELEKMWSVSIEKIHNRFENIINQIAKNEINSQLPHPGWNKNIVMQPTQQDTLDKEYMDKHYPKMPLDLDIGLFMSPISIHLDRALHDIDLKHGYAGVEKAVNEINLMIIWRNFHRAIELIRLNCGEQMTEVLYKKLIKAKELYNAGNYDEASSIINAVSEVAYVD